MFYCYPYYNKSNFKTVKQNYVRQVKTHKMLRLSNSLEIIPICLNLKRGECSLIVVMQYNFLIKHFIAFYCVLLLVLKWCLIVLMKYIHVKTVLFLCILIKNHLFHNNWLPRYIVRQLIHSNVLLPKS